MAAMLSATMAVRPAAAARPVSARRAAPAARAVSRGARSAVILRSAATDSIIESMKKLTARALAALRSCGFRLAPARVPPPPPRAIAPHHAVEPSCATLLRLLATSPAAALSGFLGIRVCARSGNAASRRHAAPPRRPRSAAELAPPCHDPARHRACFSPAASLAARVWRALRRLTQSALVTRAVRLGAFRSAVVFLFSDTCFPRCAAAGGCRACEADRGDVRR